MQKRSTHKLLQVVETVRSSMELAFSATPTRCLTWERAQRLNPNQHCGVRIAATPLCRNPVVSVLRNAQYHPRYTRRDDASTSAMESATKDYKKVSLMGIALLVVSYAWSIPFFVTMIIGHPFVLAFDRHRRRFHDFVSLLWMKVSLASSRLRPRVANRENLPRSGQPAIFVANHASYLDIFAVSFLGRNLKFVSKSEIFRLPIIGWAMSMAGNIGVKRMNRRGQMEAYRRMVEALRRGVSLVVYPEGTRSESGKMREFQSGAFRAAKAAGVPVVPVTITGTREIMPAHAYVPLRAPKKPIQLTVHPAISGTDHSVEELKDMSFNAISSALSRVS